MEDSPMYAQPAVEASAEQRSLFLRQVALRTLGGLVITAIAALEMALRKFGSEIPLGRGVAAAQEVLLEARLAEARPAALEVGPHFGLELGGELLLEVILQAGGRFATVDRQNAPTPTLYVNDTKAKCTLSGVTTSKHLSIPFSCSISD